MNPGSTSDHRECNVEPFRRDAVGQKFKVQTFKVGMGR
jgi:hypothetical protein